MRRTLRPVGLLVAAAALCWIAAFAVAPLGGTGDPERDLFPTAGTLAAILFWTFGLGLLAAAALVLGIAGTRAAWARRRRGTSMG